MNYCLDTVEMKVTSHGVMRTPSELGDSGTHVLVPILRGDRVSVVLESGLKEGHCHTLL